MKIKLLGLSVIFGLFCCPLVSYAEDDEVDFDPTHADLETADLVDTDDKSGTNPINFTFDARLYNEYQWLNVDGDGGQNITTFEFRAPIADGEWQVRAKIRANYLDVNQAGISEFGFGDMDIRFLTVPIMIPEKKFALAYGVEFFFPTASHDVLGSNAYTVGPQLFLAFFGVFDFIDLVAPGYQHQFSVYEEDGASDRNLGLIDLFILKTFNNKQQWVMLNPQGIINYETGQEWVQFDVEAGTMLKAKGHSAYIRPSLGMGGDKPYDWSLEAGYKIIW